ncbi:lycopene cyclase domain-containing protein [Cellulomonas sp. URHD0024]|uniref:lycopene cyclase domain-containing protein n=1 Tax=Cellulomonas sp. URHD0024 TaxID=1302620 RepID=UPI0004023F12|nr:lycopene cyclase domain-containing protein [Cellulomonas sp. URHD0024]
MRGSYLVALLLSLAGMMLLDARHRLFVWAVPRRAAVVLACGVTLFLAWDAAAIARGIFERGWGGALLGLEVAPHLPIEELLFVTFFSYLTMVVFTATHRVVARRAVDA